MDSSPLFQSGLRRLLYPTNNPALPVEPANSEQWAETLNRLELRPEDCQALSRGRRTIDGRFVDVTSGEVLVEQTDVEIPGVVPFRWSRVWRSNQLTAGSLGNGWRHSYDFALLEDRLSRQVVIRIPDNRGILFPLLAEGEHFLNRTEKFRLNRDAYGYWLENSERFLYRFAMNPSGSICRLVTIEGVGVPYRIRLTYTSTGHLRRISDDFQRVIDVVSDQENCIRRLEITTPDQPAMRSTLVAYYYDEDRNLQEVIAQDERIAQYIYRQNRIIRLTDAHRRPFYFAYQKIENHHGCNEVKGEGGTPQLRFSYLPAEGRTQVTDGSGGVKQYMHEGGIVQRFISVGGRQRVWFFSDYGELLSEQDALGNTSFNTYDEQGNVTRMAWPDGGQMRMQYNDNGQLVALTDRAGGTWQWTYDNVGRLLSCTDPVGAVTEFAYGENGLLTQMVRGNGQWVRWEYDQYANRNAQATAEGGRIRWEYNALGQLISANQLPVNTARSSDEIQKPTATIAVKLSQPDNPFLPTYDADGQLIRLRGLDRLNWQFVRDAAGRVREYTRPDGCSTRFHYDAAGRLTEVIFDDGTWHHYSYRPDGWLIEATTPATRVQFERDPLGRIITETTSLTTVQSVYDRAGHRIGLQSSEQADVAWKYDELGRISSQQHPHWLLQYAYDRLGRLAECQMPGGLRSRWQYDLGPLPVGQQLFWGSTMQAARSQTYRWEGHQLVGLQDTRFGTVALRYDCFNEPTEATCSAGWTDRWVANRSRYQQQLLKPAPETIERGWQMIAVGVIRFYFDAEGYLRSKQAHGQEWRYQWHESGVLKQVIRPDNQCIQFRYDALGRRIEKTFADHTVKWAWDGKRLLHEWHQTPGKDLVQLTWYTAGGAEPTMLQVGEKSYRLAGNYLGQPLSLHAQHGACIWEWEWCLFGKKHGLTGPPYYHTYLGPGQFEDQEAGLTYAGFRYFDAETGLPISPEYSSPAGWARVGWEPPHAPESYLSAARYIRAY